MADRFSASQLNLIDRDARNMAAADIRLGEELNDLWREVDNGNIGITADAKHVDSLALDGGHFGQDEDNTTGLDFAYFAGRLYNGTSVVAVNAGVVTLSASTTNYVEVSRAGAVSKNTVGFTAGAIPLYVIATGVSTIATVTNYKTLLSSLPNGGIPGTQLSQGQKTKGREIHKGTLSATGTIKVQCPSVAARISRISIVVDTTIAANDTNYWTFTGLNKEAGGAGTTAILLATDVNTTKVTGGSAITAYIARAMSLHGTAGNLVTAANDVLVITATKTASASDLVMLDVLVEFEIDL